jgi:hypothetical protein
MVVIAMSMFAVRMMCVLVAGGGGVRVDEIAAIGRG